MGSENSKEVAAPEMILKTSKDECDTLTTEDYESMLYDSNEETDPTSPSWKFEALSRIIGAAKGSMTQPLMNFIKK